MSNNISKFIGIWAPRDEDTAARYKIEVNNGIPIVQAYDTDDGEIFDVDNIIYQENTLKFRVTVPSNGYKSNHEFKLRNDGNIEHKLIISETWVKE